MSLASLWRGVCPCRVELRNFSPQQTAELHQSRTFARSTNTVKHFVVRGIGWIHCFGCPSILLTCNASQIGMHQSLLHTDAMSRVE
jgi:hypothetical protein